LTARAALITAFSQQARAALQEGHRSGHALGWEEMRRQMAQIFEQAAVALQQLTAQDLAAPQARGDLIHLLLCGVRGAVSPLDIEQANAWVSALDAHPVEGIDLARLHAAKGRIAMRLGEHAQALLYFEHALRDGHLSLESSERFFVLECLLVLAEKRVDLPRARDYFEQARRLDAPDSHAVLSLTLNFSNILQNLATLAASAAQAEAYLDEARNLLRGVEQSAQAQAFIDLEVPALVQLVVADHRQLNRWLDDAGLQVVEDAATLDERCAALYPQLEQRYRHCIGRMRALHQPMRLRIMGNLAVLQKRFCRFEEAQEIFETVLEEAGALLQPDPILLADTHASLGEILFLRGQGAQSLAQFDLAIATAEKAGYSANIANYQRSRTLVLDSRESSRQPTAGSP
jgi:tetratricopeptide (TPR) repeat protein